MKILNPTYRDVDATSGINLTKVSELEQTANLDNKSLLHIVEFVAGGENESQSYESRKITAGQFKQKLYESVQNTLKTSYWDTHCDPSSTEHNIDSSSVPGSSFHEMIEYLRNQKDDDGQPVDLSPDESNLHGVDGFVKHINFDFELLRRYVVVKNMEIKASSKIDNGRITELDCMFSPQMTPYTTKRTSMGDIRTTGSSVNHSGDDNNAYCQMNIEDGNKISNEWVVPASGNLVVYGWLDSNSCLNNKAIQSAYCAIEAKINSVWEIIGVQPVIPAKNITYVGFNLPVKRGLVIRARTGFTVGVKSSQYSNDQDGYDTLSNSTANGFRCMVFSNYEYSMDLEVEFPN